MRIVLDTNVVISGIFFVGPPYQILKAWREGKLHLVVSEEILAEYRRWDKWDRAPYYPLWISSRLFATLRATEYPGRLLLYCDK